MIKTLYFIYDFYSHIWLNLLMEDDHSFNKLPIYDHHFFKKNLKSNGHWRSSLESISNNKWLIG